MNKLVNIASFGIEADLLNVCTFLCKTGELRGCICLVFVPVIGLFTHLGSGA